MLEELQTLFCSVTGREDLTLTEKTKLKTDLGVSSLALITLIGTIEDRYGVEIPNTSLRHMKTVGDLIKFIQKSAGDHI